MATKGHIPKNLASMEVTVIFLTGSPGYYVCPWCCSSGTWEDLCRVFDSRLDTLLEGQLEALLETAENISPDVHLKKLSCLVSAPDYTGIIT